MENNDLNLYKYIKTSNSENDNYLTYETTDEEKQKFKEIGEKLHKEREERLAKEENKRKERMSHMENVVNVNGMYIHSLHVDRKKMFELSKKAYRFYTDDFEFKNGVNLLFGGNGQGKSSLIYFLSTFGKKCDGTLNTTEEMIWDCCRLKKNSGEVNIYSFCNSKNNERYNYEPDNAFSFVRHMQTLDRSEGQNVMQSVSDFLYILNDDKVIPVDKECVVFVDEIDSGLDAIACRYLVNKINKIVKRKPNMQIFVAFNQYEMSKLDSTWINVCTGEIEDCPKNYDEYFNRLNANKKKYKRKVDSEVRK